nr:hypothetical protein [Tanacetum cinerariifolium]
MHSNGPYKPTTIIVQVVAATNDSPAIPEHTTVETPMNMSPANKSHFESEKEAIHLILTGIRDEIYPTVDACQTAQVMWEAIKRLQQEELALITKYFKKIYKPTNNNLRTSSNSRNKNVDMTPRYKNDNQSGQFGNKRTMNVAGARENECRKPKTVKDSEYHKEKMLLCKQAEKGVPLQAEQYDWLENTDEEIDVEELDAHYSYIAKIKKIQKQLKKANTTLAQELKECKTILAKTSKTLWESNSVWDSCLVAHQNKQTEFEKYKAFNDHTIDYDKLKQIVDNAWIKHSKDQFRAPTAQDMEILIQTCLMPLALKAQNDSFMFVHELKQEMHADLNKLKKLVEKGKGKSMETKFDKPSVVRQPNAQQIPKPSVLGVNHKSNVSRPHLRSNHIKDKVVPNNSQVKLKKTKIEDHPRILSISNKNKSVTACNDSLNSKTSNANAVCATCGKYLVDSNHFTCITKMLNDMIARTKKPNVVPISTRKPKGYANKSVVTPHKKKVASKSTTQKPNYYRMLYEKTSKTWKWWIEQQCPSGYKRVPKTKMQWVPKARNENVQKIISFAIDNASRITNVLKRTNSLGSNLSNVPSSSNSLADYSSHPIHC